MKPSQYCSFFLICAFSFLNSYSQQRASFLSNNIFQTDNFIENKGQFNIILNDSLSEIDFAISHGTDEIYFNKYGFKYHIIHATPRQETIEERREDEENEEEEEKRMKFDVAEDWFKLEWIGSNPQAQKQQLQKTNHYFTYGNEHYNSYGYKEIAYQNIYPGININYQLHEKGGIKYSLILHPNADINDLRFKYTSLKGVRVQSENNRITIMNDVGSVVETDIKAFYSDGEEVRLDYVLDSDQVIHFKAAQPIDKQRILIIDPWVSAVSSLTGLTNFNNVAYDVDYDLFGNLIAIGGGGYFGATSSTTNLPKLAKYDNLGNLLWTFSGFNVLPTWSSSPIANGNTFGTVGNFVVDKLSNKIYMSQGWRNVIGASILRLGTNGNYDNFISTPLSQFNEIWEMKFNCTNGKLIGMGGSTSSPLNIGIIDTTTTFLTTSNVTGITTSNLQDIICSTIDGNGDVYTIFASSGTTSVNNKIFKLNSNYTSSIWSAFSGYNSFAESNNKPYTPTNNGYSNGFNALAVNNDYLFYYDGKNLKAFNKVTGAVIGTSYTIPVYVAKYQGGIYANDCNEVYIGGNNGNIIRYLFNGSTFVVQDTFLINGYSGKSVYDIVYNPLNNLLYVCGNGFVASIDPSSTCSVNISTGNIQLGASVQCPDSALVSIVNPDSNVAYTFIWVDSSSNTTLQNITLPVGTSANGMSGLIPGHTIHVTVLKSSACQVISNDTSFIVNCNITTVNLATCPGDSIMLSNGIYVSTPGTYIDTFTNIFSQDSIVYFVLSNYTTYANLIQDSLCTGSSYLLPGGTLVNTSGTYVDSLLTIHGCDSIITTQLIFYPNSTTIINDTICSNQTYTLPNNTIVNVSGTYIDTFSSINNCDSIITVHLVVNPEITLQIFDTICNGQTYVLPNLTTVSTPGVYTNVFSSAFNCDSIIIVHLHVTNQILSTENITLCNQSSYLLPNGNIVSVSGTYISNLVSINGCDSIITSHVKLGQSTFSQNEVLLCENKTYQLPDGVIVNSEGIYVSKINNTDGCDSIITTTVKIQTLPEVDLGRDTMLCGNSGIRLDVYTPGASYMWDDGTKLYYNVISDYGLHYVTVTKHPCDPVTDSIEIIKCPCNVFIPNAYTPNKDNKNDTFKPIIKCTLDPELFSFKVFNRWGEVVFYTTLQDDGWDGTYHLVDQNVGTYMYLLQFKNPETGKMELYKGDVTLIR